jgi:hypothetical protein
MGCRSVQIIETEDVKEVRRCRLAQFSGRSQTLDIGGKSYTGLVQSIRELQTLPEPRWIVTIARDQAMG